MLILKDHDVPQLYGLTIPESLSPYELYINGHLIGGLGDLASDHEYSASISRPITYYFTLDSSVSEILIQGAYLNRYSNGGQLLVPPLSIQTLVENAIQHGILKRREGGTIQIRITESKDQYTVAIIDNGIGFDSSAPQNSESVGLINTSQRLKQLFLCRIEHR